MFEFLNSSAWSICGLLRNYLNDWAKDFEEDAEFLSRYRNKDMNQYYSAEFELLLYTILKNQGFMVERHPDLGKLKRPDFKAVAPSGEQLLLECTLAGDSFDSHSDQNLKATVEEIIDDIDYYPYTINVAFKTISKTSISKRKILHFLEVIRQQSESIPNEQLIEINHRFEDNGWHLEFSMYVNPNHFAKEV
jgi:hypothetical protein